MRRFLLGGGLLALVCAGVPAEAAGLRCPGRMPGPHAGFEAIGPLPPSSLPLEGLSLFDGPPGEENQPSPVALAPDSTIGNDRQYRQIWNMRGVEAPLAVCHYRDTTSYYRSSGQLHLRRCELRRGPDGVLAGCE